MTTPSMRALWCLLILGTPLPGATLLWNGGGTDDNWSTALNWSGTAFTAGDTLQFGGSTRLTPVNNLAADTLVGGLEFLNNTNPNISAFTLSGSRITLGGNITTNAVTGGAFNATITDVIELDLLLNDTRTITTNNNGDKTHNLTVNGSISETGGAHGIVKAGGSRLTLNSANSYTGGTSLTNGVLVLGHANALPGGTGTAGGTSGLTFAGTVNSGAILGLGAGDFTRALGTGADQVQWTGHGGFAAFGADRVVNLGGAGTTVQWDAGGFVPNNFTLVFGYGNGTDTQDSTHTLDFQNPIDLNGGTRSIRVNDGNNGGANGPARIDAVLTGGLTNSTGTGAFSKDGTGVLSLTAASTYTGQTRVNDGVVLLNHANALPGGTAVTGGTSNLRLAGNGAVVGLTAASGNFTRDLGTGVEQVQWTSGGGFAAYGVDRFVNIGGAGAQLVWGAGGFVTTGQTLTLSHVTADAMLDFQNSIDLGSATRNISIGGSNGGSFLGATVSGALSGSGGLIKSGDGNLALTAVNSTFTGQLDIQSNVLRVTKLADFGQDSSIGHGTAGVAILMSTQFRTGILEYVGSGDSSDRTFRIGTTGATHTSGATIRSSGTGALLLDAPVLNETVAGVTVARPLALGGTNTGLNTISGVIQNTDGATGVLNLVKENAGTWVLAGPNTYTGSTTLSGGTLHLNHAGTGGTSSAIGTGAFSIGSGTTIDNSSGAAITLSTANAVTWGGSFTYGGTNDLSFANGTALTTGSRTITLNGTGRTLAFGTLSATNSNTLTTNDNGTGNKLVLGGLVLAENNQARTQTLNGSADVEILGTVADGPGTGADNLSYTGNGSLKLSGSNTYTGATTLNNAAGTLTLAGSSTTSLMTLSAGTLNINHANAIGSGTLDINAGTIDNTSGAAITVATANLVTLDGNFAFGGGHDLSFANGTASTTGGRTITLNGTGRTLTFGVLSFTNSNTTTVNDAGSGNKLVLGGLVLGENNQGRTQTFTGTAAIDITGAVADGPGTGAESLTYTGTNVMRLMGTGTYTGTTTVNTAGGILRTTSTGSLGAGNVVVVQGTLELQNTAQTVGTVTFGSTTTTAQTTAATITLAAGTTLTLTGNLTANDNVNTQASFLTGGTVDLNGVRTWTVDDSAGVDADLTVSSVIQNSGAGTFTKNGTGRLVLSGHNTFADVFAVGDGIVRIQHANALGTTAGGTTVNSGDALEIDGGITVAGESLLLNGTGPAATGALRSVSGINAWTGVIDLAGDARINADAGSQLTVGAITAGGTSRDITFGGDGDHIASGRIGSGGTNPVDQVYKDGAGTLTLGSAANDFTSTLNINNGIVKLGASQVIPDAENVTINKGVLELNGFTETIAALALGATTTTVAGNASSVIDTAGGGILRLTNNVTYHTGSGGFENAQGLISANLDVNNSTRTFTVNDNTTLAVDLVVSGAISNSGASAAGLTKAGLGTLVLSGANTYNSTTTISAGTLKLGAANTLPNTTLSLDQRVGGASTLDLAGHSDEIGALNLSSTGSTAANSVNQIIDSVGGSVLKLGGNVTYNSGASGFHNATALVSVNIDLNGTTRTFTINDSTNAADDTLVSGVISNSGAAAGLSKSGAGVLVLSAANTYDGTTTINSGVIRAAHNQAFGTVAGVALNNTGGTLELADGITIDRALSVTNSGGNKVLRLQDGAASATYSGDISILDGTAGEFDVAAPTGGTLTLSGVISGTAAAGLSTEGQGTIVLTGANTYTSATNVNAGALQVGQAGVGQTGTGNVNVASGSTILGTGIVRGTNVTLADGSTLRPGDGPADSSHGTLTFTPASASGATHDLQGTIVLGITSATHVDASFGGFTIGSTDYNTWVDGISGTGGHDRLLFTNPDTGTGYTLNFLTATGALQVVGSGFTPQGGQVFHLLDWGTLVTANFTGFNFNTGYLVGNGDEGADLNLPDLTGTGLLWDFSRFTTSGNIVVVPEPSRALLLAAGLAAVIARRRRNRSNAHD
ncbi:MAG: autotransporter-associated beta strand repeat-containing protein [Verrucomicrobiaceae bacterium]|nr:autotransporter-associated beta strand repeat-containing protein [Verrucomicrobiaceae bacterium]